MSASFYWDACENLHTRYANEFPQTQAAVGAVRRIRTVLEPHWKVSRFNEHPLSHILMVAPRPQELSHLATKLELLARIPGSESVIPRLGSRDEFAAAWYEADFALKLTLGGWECGFVPRTSDPGPDLLAKMGGQAHEVEVTSLNPPREDQLSHTLASMIFDTQFRTKCAIGGVAYISSRRMTNASLSEFRSRLLDATNRAQTEATCVTVDLPGIVTAQVASWGAASLMDPRWRGAFRFDQPTPLPKERRLASVVDDKVRKQLSGKHPAVLAVYDRLLTDDEEERLARHDLSVQVGTYRQLKAVVLIRPRMWTDPFEPRLNEDEMRVFGRHPLPDREAESFIIWRNMMDPKSADIAISSITNFPSNLAKLYAEA